jgi:hypothetical protein
MGRKPVGKKAMTDAERQRRRRQRLREVKPNSVTENLSRNGQAAERAFLETLQKKIDRLEKANKRLREDAQGWQKGSDMNEAHAARLREELRQLKADFEEYQTFKHEKAMFEMDRLLKPSVITAWYRELAKKYHPDRTLDDGTSMKVVNAARDLLRELLSKSS